MNKLFYEVITHRLGNVLALIDLFLIALHSSGISERLGLVNMIRLSFLLSVPSRLASAVIFNERLLPYWSLPSSLAKYSFIALVLIYFQWVTIGWIAQKISRAIQPMVI
jgi:hypothetical protein